MISDIYPVPAGPLPVYSKRLRIPLQAIQVALDETDANPITFRETFGYTPGGLMNHTYTVDAATNRLTGTMFNHDANGNMIQMPSGTTSVALEYDVANRMRKYHGGAEVYGYVADNRRVWKHKAGVGSEITFWGIGGGRASTFNLQQTTTLPYLTLTETARNVWFGGKLIRTGAVGAQASVVVDRLGSMRVSKVGSTVERLDYWPYGEEKPGATGQEREKFATYARDATGLDYADQRYFGSVSGRFLTADPLVNSVIIADAGTTSAYAQSNGDPINQADPSGLAAADIDEGLYVPAGGIGQGGGGCVKYFDAPPGTADASNPCPPGYLWTIGSTSRRQGQLGVIRAIFEQLDGIIDDWDYHNGNPRIFDITLSRDLAQDLIDSGTLVLTNAGVLVAGGTAAGTLGGVGAEILTALGAAASSPVVITVAGIGAAAAVAYVIWSQNVADSGVVKKAQEIIEETGKTMCEVLKELYDASSGRERNKVKATQKAYDCRRSGEQK